MNLRLTNTDRESVQRKALEFAFAERERGLRDEEDAIGRAAYAMLFSEKIRKSASQLPERWLQEDSCLRLSFRGMQTTINLISGVRVPSANHSCHRIGDISDEALSDRFLKFEASKDAVRRDRGEASNNLNALLSRFYSLKSMADSWPEGRQFYEHLQPREASSVPAVQITSINKMLGLPAAQNEPAE